MVISKNNEVAPFAGAWIETINMALLPTAGMVAPFAGAWIETIHHGVIGILRVVAPFAGAWIETKSDIAPTLIVLRRTLRGCVD